MSSRNFAQTIADRLRAGALVLVVQEADELLALSAIEAGAEACTPVRIMSASDPEVMTYLEAHKEGSGTLVLLDYLSVYGENPLSVRLVREIALQQREDGGQFSRLILVESPEVKVPPVLAGDVEVIAPPLPNVEQLAEELDSFIETQEIEMPGANGEFRYAVAGAVAGLARHEAARLFARCWIEKKKLDPAWLRAEKAERVAAKLGGALTFESTESANVGGLDGLRTWLGERRDAFSSPKAKKFGLPEPKGLLLLGCPGTGKSLTAKAVAREWGLPLLRLDAGRLFGSLVGQSEMQTRQAIEAAEACAPCVLWVDEIEKGLGGGGSGSSGDSGTTQRVFGALLTWLQEKTAPVFVVATANRIAALPPELLRKGRFDEIFFIGLPNVEERREIAQIHIERRGRDLNPKIIAEATEGFSGAEIEQVIVDGLFTAFAAGGRNLRMDDVLEAAKRTTPLSKTMGEEIRALEKWAEGRARMASSGTKGKGRRRGPLLN